jgi:hypothetical protein
MGITTRDLLKKNTISASTLKYGNIQICIQDLSDTLFKTLRYSETADDLRNRFYNMMNKILISEPNMKLIVGVYDLYVIETPERNLVSLYRSGKSSSSQKTTTSNNENENKKGKRKSNDTESSSSKKIKLNEDLIPNMTISQATRDFILEGKMPKKEDIDNQMITSFLKEEGGKIRFLQLLNHLIFENNNEEYGKALKFDFKSKNKTLLLRGMTQQDDIYNIGNLNYQTNELEIYEPIIPHNSFMTREADCFVVSYLHYLIVTHKRLDTLIKSNDSDIFLSLYMFVNLMKYHPKKCLTLSERIFVKTECLMKEDEAVIDLACFNIKVIKDLQDETLKKIPENLTDDENGLLIANYPFIYSLALFLGGCDLCDKLPYMSPTNLIAELKNYLKNKGVCRKLLSDIPKLKKYTDEKDMEPYLPLIDMPPESIYPFDKYVKISDFFSNPENMGLSLDEFNNFDNDKENNSIAPPFFNKYRILHWICMAYETQHTTKKVFFSSNNTDHTNITNVRGTAFININDILIKINTAIYSLIYYASEPLPENYKKIIYEKHSAETSGFELIDNVLVPQEFVDFEKCF